MKKLVCILIALFMVAAAMPVFATPTASGDLATEYFAIPYKDGVLISYNAAGHSWCESYLTPEGGVEGQYDRNSQSSNNATWHNVFYNEDSTFSNGVVFDNTPGKTYTIRVIGYKDGGWVSVVSAFTYTVPSTPTLTVASTDLTNTLTYTLVNNGKGGKIYRYDSEAKAKIGGDDFDAEFDITYGGDPVTDTVDAAGTYYYTIKQEGISDTPLLITSPASNNVVANTNTYFFSVEEGDNNSFTITGTNNDAAFANGFGRAWTVPKMIDMVFASAANAQSSLIPSIADSSTWYSFVTSLDGVTDSNGAINMSAGITYTLDGTSLFDFNGSNQIQSTKLQRGQTYRLHLTSCLNDGSTNQWANEAITFVIPELTVVSATNTEPVAPQESWITNMEVASDGVVNININMPEGTWWGEVAIFTEEKTITCDGDIYNYKLDRGARNAVISGNWNGTIGPNNTDYDLPFTFVDGTTYYVYVIRYIGDAWEYNTAAYEFTYVAPAVEPDVEDAWISDMTVNDDGSVKVTIDVPDDTSWTEIAIFTEDLGDIDFDTLYAGVLSRPNNGSFPYQGVEAIIGANGDFAFEFEDGVTYYVYTCRYAGNGWDNDHLSSAYEFTYEAPEPEQGTADVSVLLYGLTALMAGGAFVALKRKK